MIRNVILAATLLPLILATIVAAAPYGQGSYGKCEYGTGCNTPQHTITTTPSGLEVAINLTNGQTIPLDGYTVTITPLNGSGSSFNSAEIYIDDKLVATISPGEDGTARWFWDIEKYPGKSIKIVIKDNQGKTITKEFRVTIQKQSEPPDPTPPIDNNEPPTPNGQAGPESGLTKFLQSLPKFIVVAFPYLLFILLLLEMIILLLMTKRETKELATLEALIERERTISAMKKDFVQLISHYLRTPLTLISGGIDTLSSSDAAGTTISNLRQAVGGLNQAVEGIIAKSTTVNQATTSLANGPSIATYRTRERIIIWLPVVLVGLVATAFVHLANNVTKYDVGLIGLLIQLVVFSIIVLILFFAWRQLGLRRRDKHQTERVLAEEVSVQAVRDQVINETAGSLEGHISALAAQIQDVASTATAKKFIEEGVERLRQVQEKFSVARSLKGSRSTAQYTIVSLKDVYAGVQQKLASLAQEKQITLRLNGDGLIATQDPALTQLVIETVVDNAIAYSENGGTIEIDAQSEGEITHVNITDHGTGIPPEKLDILFQPFSKVEGSEVFNHEGMGFSLYLDKLIMTYFNGDIAVESAEGDSTEVRLSLAGSVPAKAAG